MKNLNRWAFAVVFAAIAHPLVAQVSNQPAAAISPFEQLAVTSAAEFAKANPGTRHHHVLRESKEMEEAAEEFNERQSERVERGNLELERRFLEIQRAGGWQKVFLGQLEHARQVLPNSTAQLDAAQQLLSNFAICQTPLVASVISEFQETFNGDPNAGPPFVFGRIDKESTIEPLAAIMLDGCAFGPDAGQIELVFNPDVGVTAPLQIKLWSDDSILATLPRMPGLKDQEAELVITTKSGVQATVPVQFFQHRIAAPFDPVGQVNSLAVGTTAHTTNDDFRTIDFSGFRDIIAGHYTFCCSSVSGTDRWFFKLNNGWQMAVPPTFLVRGYDDAEPFPSRFFVRFDILDGVTECGLFSSGEGSVTGFKILGAPPDFPQFQGELDVSWQVGSNCSGIVYAAQILIVGPEGVSYI